MSGTAGRGGRYAIYFSPDQRSALGRFGRQWLGYDAVTGERRRPTMNESCISGQS
jgi:hypothetical protein